MLSSSRARASALTLILLAGCGPTTPRQDTILLRRAGDLIAAGPSLHVTESVPSDVIVAGGEVGFTGSAGFDYLGAGGRQEIGGQVGGSARAAGGDVRLTAEVQRNISLAGGRVEVMPGAVVHGNAYLAGGTVRVAGSVGQVLQAAGGEILLDGQIGGDVYVRGDRLRVGPTATIAGNLDYQVPEANVTIDPAAQIDGEISHTPPPARTTWRLLIWLWRLGFLAVGAAVIALFPRAMAAAGNTLRRRAPAAAGFGLLWIIGVPLLAALVGITVVGLPLALVLVAVYVITLYLGRLVVGIWLGRLILGERADPGRRGLLLSFLIGGLILLLAGRIPLFGPAVTILATLAGIGAAVAIFLPERRSGESGSVTAQASE